MSQYVATPTKSFTSGGVIPKYARVKLAAGVVTVAAADELHIGTAVEPAFASGVPVTVLLRTAQGTHKMIAGGIFSAGIVYTAAAGTVDDSGSYYAGIALQAATAANDIIEVLDDRAGSGLGIGLGGQLTVEHFTAGDTLTSAESGKTCTNLGAAAPVALTLPQDATDGVFFDFVVMVAQELRLEPGAAGGIYINGAKQTDDLYVTANAINESLRLTSLGNGDWMAQWTVGTWTVEGA